MKAPRLIKIFKLNKAVIVMLSLLLAGNSYAERIKDMASIAGVRANQLVGYGLVVGLNGSGDQTSQAQFTVQSLKTMLGQLGVVIPENVNPQLKNVAAVMIHAELPAFAKVGQRIDVTVSSIGNANSLRGGSLLMTPLKGVDGSTYALAQGNLIVSGFGVEGADGSSVTVNIPSSGRIPNGAMVEREVANSFADNTSSLMLNLNQADFTTALNLTEKINEVFGAGTAEAIDSSSVKVRGPSNVDQKVAFIAALENLEVEHGTAPARVIINSRTGTVVISSTVVVDEAAVAHGSLVVTILESNFVSQPGPFSGGETEVVQNSSVFIEEEDNRMFLFQPGVSLDELVRAVNQVGASPSDLVAILEALQQVGALRAQLIVI
ncbi:MAG: flagellar biosynthesis protein FlgI [SAR86 cluster bacterium]|uniref:Flagellar P-ring protein n=1 Tax=SAR86 cluster bacterium TaxID=2030880 RepID=A0A2A5CB86_9GAMM|nr:MAG: flagellar biosynthesis protein FlgI [SAR86 cluster bacterium]